MQCVRTGIFHNGSACLHAVCQTDLPNAGIVRMFYADTEDAVLHGGLFHDFRFLIVDGVKPLILQCSHMGEGLQNQRLTAAGDEIDLLLIGFLIREGFQSDVMILKYLCHR